ncbi:hypothetical protein CZ674_06905 [Agrococcus casei LMG 22410]|uniref:Uncharacterized protein n=1 Tax=Agrococcus casei LMG 22410 TaxID=1255656 RepID=A0A1R4FVZ5_9MICO|nr:hypothetical protein CZ674_06905 [Agrococcus casei LMG 22410]
MPHTELSRDLTRRQPRLITANRVRNLLIVQPLTADPDTSIHE